MRTLGLAGVHRRRRYRAAKASRETAPAPDLVQRDFHPGAPGALWAAEITYVAADEGFLYLAVVLDASAAAARSYDDFGPNCTRKRVNSNVSPCVTRVARRNAAY